MIKICIALLASALALVATPAQAQLYEIQDGTITHDRREVFAVKVQVDGTVANTRSFLQDFMKDTYNVRLKSGALASLGVGKKDELSAQQVSGIGVSSRAVDLYAALSAPSDSTTEVALFGAFGDKTFFEPGRTVPEIKGLRNILAKYSTAARVNAYRQQVADAENSVDAVEKQKTKLERSTQSAQSNTASNLKRIDELLRQNQANVLQIRQDSVQLISNAQLREAARLNLERRRDRLNSVAPKK
ncbi:hypothetical protein GO988_10450 [Hymenobacter sp. HMF4947]|uniref:Uncharacterized protein n=1 Tax=Hymenobacter ginkgonis TaxID=2682976 RepID=A0A7K1TF35_9BACT|nr:hypothetical protein [Hymenobacter ginkgonis]MVN76741.1 hypothetical protein [Hymenobacter ginkgonis]